MKKVWDLRQVSNLSLIWAACQHYTINSYQFSRLLAATYRTLEESHFLKALEHCRIVIKGWVNKIQEDLLFDVSANINHLAKIPNWAFSFLISRGIFKVQTIKSIETEISSKKEINSLPP